MNLNPFTSFSLVLILVSINSCSKKDSPPAPVKTKTELLTGNTWKYNEYYRNYNGTSGTIYYKRGSSGNLINLDPNRVTFYANGTYSELNETGAILAGTWHLINNETQLQVQNSMGTFLSNIVSIEENSFIWLDPTTSNGTYAKMGPQ
jgi:hypothetical protein